MIIQSKKFFIIVALIAALNTLMPLQAMDALRNRLGNLTWKTAAAGALAGTLTAAHYGCALYIPYHFTTSNVLFSDIEKLEDASPRVQAFVKKQLIACGLKNHESLKIKQGNQFAALTTNDNMWVFLENHDIIEQVLEHYPRNDVSIDFKFEHPNIPNPEHTATWHQTPEQFLLQAASMLQHEATHLVNNDSKRTGIAITAIPLAIEALSFCIGNGFKKYCPRVNTYIIKNMLKIPTGLIKGYCSTSAFFAFSRYKEQQADNGINDNIHLLHAQKEERKTKLILNKWDGSYKEDPFYWNLNTHPSDETRIKKFEQRIKTLEQKNDPASFINPLEIKEENETK